MSQLLITAGTVRKPVICVPTSAPSDDGTDNTPCAGPSLAEAD